MNEHEEPAASSEQLALEARWRREDEQRAAERQTFRATENARIRRERESAEEQARQERAEARRLKAEEMLKAELRRAFLAQPAASDADFEKIYPKLRLEHLAREATEAPRREKAALLARGSYGL